MTEAAAPATPSARMTLPQQAVVNLAAFVAVSVMQDGRMPVAVDMLDHILPQARKDAPAHLMPLLDAATDLVAAYPACRKREGALAWMRANLALDAALADVFFQRAALATDAHAQSQTPRTADAAA